MYIYVYIHTFTYTNGYISFINKKPSVADNKRK